MSCPWGGGKSPKIRLGGYVLGRFLPGLRRGVGVHEQVACVDLDQVMDQQHRRHPAQVGAWRRVAAQDLRHQGQVPGVLGGILFPGAVQDAALPQHALELVGLPQEAQAGIEGAHDAIGSAARRGGILRCLWPLCRAADPAGRKGHIRID